MFDTMRLDKSRLLVFVMTIAFVISGLPVRFHGNSNPEASAGPPISPKRVAKQPASTSRAAMAAQSSPTYDLCLQNESGGSTLSLNTTTGDYIFTCGNCVKKVGRGTLTVKGCTFTLEHNISDRRVLAKGDKCARTGTASLQSPVGTTACTITDKNGRAEACNTDLQPPQINVTAPDGGEIVDAGSSFTITWNVTDESEIASQDVLLSTDSGATFSPIVTGLAGAVTEYAWLAPLIADNQAMRVRVTARDAACNTAQDDSDNSFTLWNPAGALPHVAETPIYMVGGGFRSIIHLCNTSPNAITVEIGLRNRYGTALAKPPTTFTLNSGQVRAIDASGCLTLGAPAVPGDRNINMGSIRLRHNGANDTEVRAILAVDQDGEEQSYTAPFVYLASAQLPTSTMQCSPLYYVDSKTSAYLALQNITNSPVPVNVMLHYGTGATGTPDGNYLLPQIVLAPQQTIITDLATSADQLQETHWGSIQVSAPAQTIVAHAVMMSDANALAFNSSFVDPAMCANTTKVISTLKLDYNMDMKACVMICNTSGTETRTVTVSFQSDNGTAIPSQQVTLGPKQQRLIELDSRSLLGPEGSANANVCLIYNGNPADIIGGAVSMSAASNCAIPAQFIEPKVSDGRRLVAPFFRFDERTSGILQVSNLSANDVKAGVMMKFADTTLPTLNTDLLTVPAGGTATIDLRDYFSLVDDTVSAQGCVEVLHNGTPGAITASFTAVGVHNNISLEVALQGGPPFAANDLALFPNNKELQVGEATEVAAMTGSALIAPAWSVSATVGNPGTITPLAQADPNVYCATYTSSQDPSTVAVTVKANATSSGGPIKDGTITLEKVKIKGFATPVRGRMRPEGGTPFTITGKKEWPDTPLEVRFTQGSLFVSTISVSRSSSDPKVLTGTAPTNNIFIGDAQVVVLQDGAKITKDKTGAAYYAYDPPSPPTSVNPPGFNRLGGNMTITAQGGGFREFRSSATGKDVKPQVEIGREIDFAVNTVSDTQINGNALRAAAKVECCQCEESASVPCKFIRVRNPGARKDDEVSSVVPLYNLLPGPPPTPQSRFPDFGPSIGGTVVTIRGQNLDFVDNVTIGGTDAPIISKENNMLIVSSLPHVAGAGNPIILFDIDNAAPGGTTIPGGAFRYDLTKVKELPVGTSKFYLVGPGEGVELQGALAVESSSPVNCINSSIRLAVTPVGQLPTVLPGVLTFKAEGTFNCSTCNCGPPDCPRDVNINIKFRLVNAAAPNDSRFRLDVTRAATVPFRSSPDPMCSRTF